MIDIQTHLDGIDARDLEGFFVGWPSHPDRESHRRILEESYAVALAVDTSSGRVVGFANAISDGVLSAYIPLLEVIPDRQGQGIGTRLIEELLDQLDDLYMVDLACDPQLESFYEPLGFQSATAMIRRNYDRQSGRPAADPSGEGYLESLPAKRMGAGLLLLNDEREILIVNPTYKDHWEIPGGVVEEDESPRQAALRETREEIDLAIEPDACRPLGVEYSHTTSSRPEALMWVFFGGILTPADCEAIVLRDDELSDHRFAPIEEARPLLGELLGPRIERCMSALARDGFSYREVDL